MEQNSKNQIGFKATISLVIGNIIGVGIFTTTGYIANYIDSSILILSLWLFGGLYAISGAIVYGLLAKQYPLSGGDFQYLSKEIHPALGYVFGWSALTITYTGSIAALAIGASYYFNSVFELLLFEEIKINLESINWVFILNTEKLIAILLVIFFSWINFRGIKISGKYQTGLTFLIVIFIILFGVIGLFSIPDFSNFSVQNSSDLDISKLFVAFVAVVFTFIGWTSAVYIAEEVKNPKIIIPKSLLNGVLIVTFLYFLINLVFILAVPLNQIKNAINVATPVSKMLWGENISVIVSFFIFIAVLSTLNSTILSGSRIYMAMSREGYLFGKLSKLHRDYQTPHRAIQIQLIWSILLILSGSFNQLLSFVVFVVMIFSTLAGIIAIKIILNKKDRKLKIAFCGIYCIICASVGINTFLNQTRESVVGLFLIFLSFLFYLYEVRNIEKNTN